MLTTSITSLALPGGGVKATGFRVVCFAAWVIAADKDPNIELMNERAAMLDDLANQVSLMKHDLADLLRWLVP